MPLGDYSRIDEQRVRIAQAGFQASDQEIVQLLSGENVFLWAMVERTPIEGRLVGPYFEYDE